MGGAEFPPCCCLAWGNPTLEATGSFVGLMVDSRKAHTKEYFPELLLPVSLSPWWATAAPCLCRRPSNTSRQAWLSLLWGHCSFPMGPDVHTTLCVPFKSGVSVSPSPVKVLQSSPSSLPSLILWEFFLLLPDPRLGSLTWGSEPSLQWVDFCGISVLQFVSHPPNSYGIWFYCDCASPTVSLWLLLCLCIWRIFFGEFRCLSVDDCSAVSCDSGALSRGSESMPFCSAILNQSPDLVFFLILLILNNFISPFILPQTYLKVKYLLLFIRGKQNSLTCFFQML